MIEVSILSFGEGQFEPRVSQVSSDAALHHLITFDFNYGGRITAVSEESLTVSTPRWERDDRTTYSGTKENMRHLVNTAFYLQRSSKPSDRNTRYTIDEMAKRLGGDHKGDQSFNWYKVIPLLFGSKRLHVALMLGMGVTKVSEIQLGIRLHIEDLLPLLGLSTEDSGASFENIAAELGVRAPAIAY